MKITKYLVKNNYKRNIGTALTNRSDHWCIYIHIFTYIHEYLHFFHTWRRKSIAAHLFNFVATLRCYFQCLM